MKLTQIIKYSGWAVFLLYLFTLTVYPNMAWLKKHNPEQTKLMQYRKSQVQKRGEIYGIDHRVVSLSQISKPMIRAAMIAEDSDFYKHHGFDWRAMWDGMWSNLRSGKVRFGASTISQQLAKNLFLYPKRSLWRKAQEAMLTFRMEHTLSKDRILELYLNSIEWGYGIYGVESASQYYFGIPAAELSEQQAAFLAALIQAPLIYKANDESGFLKQRYQWVYAYLTQQSQDQVADVELPAVRQKNIFDWLLAFDPVSLFGNNSDVGVAVTNSTANINLGVVVTSNSVMTQETVVVSRNSVLQTSQGD